MSLDALAFIALVLACIPCALFLLNLFFYRRLALRGNAPDDCEPLSVLIPARNEERNLPATLESVLANVDATFEVVVLDDHSTDRTVEIVRSFSQRDSRVRLERAPELPPGWCGKQHACHVLSGLARHPLLVFMDADVRLSADALSRMSRFMQRSGASLVSGVPRQENGTFSERLLIPLIHFVLMGFLPMLLMRWTRWSAFSAGCGQLFVARADAYRKSGGHAAIRTTLHDGVKLPRAFRKAGFVTDLFDATDVATCRMYHTNGETWRGLGKNATEGLAAPGTILPMTALLFGGQIFPWFLIAFAVFNGVAVPVAAIAAVVLGCVLRCISVALYRQPVISAVLHPLGVSALLWIQWAALAESLMGRPREWKGREYPSAGEASRPPLLGRVLPFLLASFVALGGGIAGDATNRTCASFALPDQFGVVHSLTFPRTNVLIVTVADKKGDAQVDAWIAAIKTNGLPMPEIVGIADVRGVPEFWRNGIRKRFAEKRTRAVMLDWDGTVLALFQPVKNAANVFVLNPRGTIVAHFSGPADDKALKQLGEKIAETAKSGPDAAKGETPRRSEVILRSRSGGENKCAAP
jgi:glycosyltransferase involved in cell wall biosynthesis